MRFRKRYDDEENKAVGDLEAISFIGDPGRTLQEPAEDADINVLMKRMGVKDGSALPYFQNPRALYGDFSVWPDDPVELANIMREGQLAFLRIPAAVRQRYSTPEELFAFMNDEKNYEEAVKLGLLAKKPDVIKTPLDTLVEKMDTFVSSSTSSVKGDTSAPSNSKEK